MSEPVSPTVEFTSQQRNFAMNMLLKNHGL